MGNPRDVIPSGERKSPLRFLDYILDFDACTLTRNSGEAVALTRSEFALLRFLAARPGRVASRDTLLDAIAHRQFGPFDRSIDVVVGRLRRKIEPDPKRPRIIVTVPGEGYRFDGLSLPCPSPPAEGVPADNASPCASSAAPAASAGARINLPYETSRGRRVALGIGALCIVLLLAFAGSLLHDRRGVSVPAEPPKVLVAPFANLTGDTSIDHAGHALAFEIAAFLGAYPGLRVLSPSFSARDPARDALEAARTAGARYLLHGGVRRFRNALRITATLYDAATGTAVWSQVFDPAENETVGWKEDISRRIYDSIAGLRGKIYANEERVAWGKTSAELSEYDYFLRGLLSYLRFTLPDELKARAIFQEARHRYPDSALLRLMEAWTYLWTATNLVDEDPRADVDQAWRLAEEALSTRPLSTLEAWMAHWLMAFLYQWHGNDFSQSVTEARAAIELAPYDAYSRNDLSWILANAGYGAEAIAWAREGLDHDPNGPSRYSANLAWAYYVARRDQEGADALADRSAEYPVLYAALLVRLGQVEKARTVIEDYMNSGARDTVEKQDAVPLVEPTGAEYVAVLRKAGLRER